MALYGLRMLEGEKTIHKTESNKCSVRKCCPWKSWFSEKEMECKEHLRKYKVTEMVDGGCLSAALFAIM